jgi:hypothetical protein
MLYKAAPPLAEPRVQSLAAERQHVERLLAEAKASLASAAASLPNWHDNDGMKAWLNTMLDRMDDVDWYQSCLVHIPPEILTAERDDRFAIAEAEHGNIKPLRRAYPQLAPFLHLPKRERGKRFPKVNYKVRHAKYEVSLIRGLWRRHFGRVNRRRGELSAAEIAAERCGVDVGAVISHRKRA